MKLLTLTQIIALHEMLINEFGGSDGIRDLGRLESVVAGQSQYVFGEELFKTPFEKAAMIIRSVISDHPFVDGNKRTAMLAGLTLLEINGFNISLKIKELEDFAVKVATEHTDIKTIAEWLEVHSKKN